MKYKRSKESLEDLCYGGKLEEVTYHQSSRCKVQEVYFELREKIYVEARNFGEKCSCKRI